MLVEKFLGRNGDIGQCLVQDFRRKGDLLPQFYGGGLVIDA